VALTLRTLGGLSTSEIASAFLVPEVTMSRRLVRAKQKIRLAGIPYQVPRRELLAERLSSVASVIYLIFNEGYFSRRGADAVLVELCDEAIRLARTLAELMPEEPEVMGLLALLLLHHSRRGARDRVLEEQDRSFALEQERDRRGHLAHPGCAATGRPHPFMGSRTRRCRALRH
jgi:RNA polymerase sigma-70 factor (ECF subfamily)